jgi:hypothetical protein
VKLLSISNAKAIWLFPTQDLNPKGIAVPELMSAVRDRYKFHTMPTPAQFHEFQTKKSGIPFSGGSFKSSDGLVEVSVTYFADGIMAESRAGTEVGDEFIADFLAWIKTDYSMIDPDTLKIRRIYTNEVYVEMNHPLALMNPKLNNIAERFADAASWPIPHGVEVTGIAFGANPVATTNPPLPALKIERDANAPFENNRYFSVAPLQTQKHLVLLAEFEEAMAPVETGSKPRLKSRQK